MQELVVGREKCWCINHPAPVYGSGPFVPQIVAAVEPVQGLVGYWQVAQRPFNMETGPQEASLAVCHPAGKGGKGLVMVMLAV
jgi:hypothetical protein